MWKRLLHLAALAVVLAAGTGCRCFCDRYCDRRECDRPRFRDACDVPGGNPPPRVLNYADDCR